MSLRERVPSPLVLKYYLYQATTTYGFFWPVFTLFHLDRGLSYSQIGLLMSLSAGATVIGEVPTGYIGDRIGRRYSLCIGSLLLAGSLLGFIFAQSFPTFALLWVLWGVGKTFQSGNSDAWLYDALETHLDDERYTTVRGQGGSVTHWVSAGTMLTAGGLYSIDHRLPFLVGGVLVGLSIPVVLSFPEARVESEERITVLDTVPVIRHRLTTPPLRSLVLYVVLFFGIISAADEFIQPIATRSLGLPESGLGPLYAGFTVAAAIASFYADAVDARLSTQWAIRLIPIVTSLFFIVPLLFPVAVFPMFFVMKSSKAVLTPIVSGYINDQVNIGRATILSAASLVYALVRVPLGPIAGAVADFTAPIPASAFLGAGFLGGATVIHLWETPAGDVETEAKYMKND